MHYQFTPAAERALAVADGWQSRDRPDDLGEAEVLLGLLAEPECRAALVLAEHGIDASAVLGRWPALAKVSPQPSKPRLFSAQFDAALRAAEARLFEHPRPLMLATEHLLLGLAAHEGEVSGWLRQAGLEADALEADIHRRAGHSPGPLPIEFSDSADQEEDWQDEAASIPPHEQIALLRVIDAAANRAGEGLRVIEDYLRFALDDVFLTRECKRLRHELAAALAPFPHADRQAARETQTDVGTGLSAGDENHRGDLGQVVTASFKRVQQALRSLEEYAKIQAPQAAARLEQLRYGTYTLERAVDITGASRAQLEAARLYVLTDGAASLHEFAERVQALVAAGVNMIQLRDKQLADRELLQRARLLAELTRGGDTLFIMNDRPDLALLSHADGVHAGQDELTVKDARSLLGPEAVIGVSTHTIEQARRAVLDGANYIGVGPTFHSATKDFERLAGIELLEAVNAEIRLPAFAIGGIDRTNLAEVRRAGFTRIAVSAAVTEAADPGAAVRELLALLG